MQRLNSFAILTVFSDPLGLVILSLLLLPVASIICVGTLYYNVSLYTNWTHFQQAMPSHPPMGPSFAFSRLRCVSHNSKYTLWQLHTLPSQALQRFTDPLSSSSEALDAQLDPRQNRNLYSAAATAETSWGPTGSVRVIVPLDCGSGMTFISCISRIVPSPGWFIGISELNMCPGSSLCNSTTTLPLVAFSAGVYTANKGAEEGYVKNDPISPISLVTKGLHGPFGDISVENKNYISFSEHNQRSCFPAGELVRLADGSRVPIEQVLSRRKVSSSDRNTQSEVFMSSHADPHAISRFTQIHFLNRDSIQSVRVSEGHFIYRFVENSGPELVQAGEVKVNDSLVGEDKRPRRVVRISSWIGRGLFNPHSLDGDLIVSGVRVSCYTSFMRPEISNALLAPMRFLHRRGFELPSRLVSRMLR